MKKSLRKIFSVMLVILMIAASVPVVASARTVSGSLGGNVRWSYDTNSKVITVSGSGNMKNFSKANDGQGFDKLVIGTTQYPNKHATKIVINEGVTNIGNNAFRALSGVKSVTIPNSVTSIGQSAFEDCTSLTSANLTEKLTSIGAYAFKNTKFASVTMPYSVKTIGNYAFDRISGVKINCCYGDAAYNYCVNHGTAYALKGAELKLNASLDTKAMQVKVTVAVKNAAGLEAANINLTYNDAVTPVSDTNYAENAGAGMTVATVFNSTGKVSIAVMANNFLNINQCKGECEFTVAELLFKVNGQADTAKFTASADPFLNTAGRTTLANSSAETNLHSYDEGKVTKAPTCAAEGEKAFTCVFCGKTKTEKIAKDANNHTGGTEVKNAAAATCGAVGYTGDTVCKGCGVVIAKGTSIAKDPTNHTGGTEIKNAVAATCGAVGYTGDTVCKGCGEVLAKGTAIPKDPGKHTGETEVVNAVAATCQKKGYSGDTVCKGCGELIAKGTETPINPDNHAGETEVRNAVEATCQKNGYSGDVFCRDCGKLISQGHVVNKVDHNYETVVTAPTCTASGFTTYTCSMCGDSYKRNAVPALGHDYDENGTCRRCGHTASATLAFAQGTKALVDNANKTVFVTVAAKASDLKSAITTTGWEFYGANGNAVESGKNVATGSTVKHSSTGTTYRVIVLGDVNMDGNVNAADARNILRASARLEQFNEIQTVAAKVVNPSAEKITAADARIVLRVSARLQQFDYKLA